LVDKIHGGDDDGLLLPKLHHICGLVEDAAIQGDAGKRAAAKIELEKVWKKYQAIVPVKLDRKLAREIIKGKLFVTEKKDASHRFVRNKGRLVARGDMRRYKPNGVLDVFSPTIAYPTFLLLLNIILLRNYEWKVADVESAYLNSAYNGKVFMKLDQYVTGIMKEMDPSIEEFIEPDGTIYVEIVKALYGLQESAKLWYETLGNMLISLEFKRSNYDHALYYKRIGEDYVFIIVYVDDMFIGGKREHIEQTMEQLKEVYSINSSATSPEACDYVGIKVEYDTKDRSFLLSQPGMVQQVIKGITEGSALPYDSKLYEETDGSSFEDPTRYRSEVMELQYLSKTRPDIKVPLAFVSTKMQNPTNGDYQKVLKIKMYIYATQDFKLRFKPSESIQVYASSDASHGSHKDGKSNTGMVVTVGFPNAPVLAKTTKQKTVANSSTAAELIAFRVVLWKRYCG